MKFGLQLLFMCIASVGLAQPVQWSFLAVAEKDGSVVLELNAQAEEGWHIYATVLPSDEGPLPTEFRFSPSDSFELVGLIHEPDPVEEYDPNFAVDVRFHHGATRFAQRIKINSEEPLTVVGELEYMCCNGSTCLPPLIVPFRIPVAGHLSFDKQ